MTAIITGLRIKIPSTVDPDSTLPWRDDYDLILPQQGGIALVELNHWANPLSGIPSGSNSIPNIAWNQAKSLVGSGDINSLALSPSSMNTSTVNSGANTRKFFERSTLGGLHGIISQVYDTVDNGGASIVLPSGIISYVLANPDHAYYFSAWRNITRPATVSGGGVDMIIGASTANFLTYRQPYTTTGGAQAGNTTINPPSSIYTGPTFSAWSPTVHTGTTSSWFNILAAWGLVSPFNDHNVYGNHTSSNIVYRLYMEDRTVSGRSYSTIETLDAKLFTAACLTVGGRYYGDTYTLPSTIP